MFEAGLFGTIEDIVLGARNALERGGYAISEAFGDRSSSSETNEKKENQGKNNATENTLRLELARKWFNTLDRKVIKHNDKFIPSFDDFIKKYFDVTSDFTTVSQDMAMAMLSTDETYSEMVENIAKFYKVSNDEVEQKIKSIYKKPAPKKLNSTNNINIDFDATDYIKEGEDIMKILMDIDAGKIDALKGIDMIKSMSNNNVTLDIGKFVADIEARVRNASKEETRIEPTSLPDVVDKKTVNLREAVESTPLGKRLFTNVEPEVVTV